MTKVEDLLEGTCWIIDMTSDHMVYIIKILQAPHICAYSYSHGQHDLAIDVKSIMVSKNYHFLDTMIRVGTVAGFSIKNVNNFKPITLTKFDALFALATESSVWFSNTLCSNL